MHRGTTIQDAGYKQGTSWPFVPDVEAARESSRFIRYAMIAAAPAMIVAYAVMFFAGASILMSLIAPAAVALVVIAIVVRLRKVRHDLLVNCNMINVIAGFAGTDIEHTAKTVFDAVSRKDGVERIAPLNDEFGVYVNAGQRMDDGRVEKPYIIFIRKHDEDVESKQAA